MIHFIVEGRVQGVNFRYITKLHADRLGLHGFVRNLSNGNVEIGVAGSQAEADSLLNLLKKEPPPIQITSISTTHSSNKKSYTSFEIVR